MRRLFIVIMLGIFSIPSLAAAQDLALKRVMLSSAGLGYFEYEATVENDATLNLTVPLDQVDDVLKSLVVYDDKGGVGGLSLPGKEPLKQAFKDMPFNEASLQSPAELLSALRGAQVSIGGGRAVSGRIVSVQPEATSSKDGTISTLRTRVTLLTDQGLQQFVLEDTENLQFADPLLREKVYKALAAVQANHAADSRTLELSSKGQGKRAVRIAYIVSVPVWKASYRMTLPSDPTAPKAALQGWATIENMSGQDWKDVELTLTSGRPVAFRQALYEAYYIERPEVPVEVAGKLMPGVDRGGVAAKSEAAAAPAAAPPPPPPAPMAPMGIPFIPRDRAAAPVEVAQSADQFEATDAATQVNFKFPRPVDVTNGRTLSIPMLDRSVPAQRIALYQPETAAHNPLAAIRLTNDGSTGLPAGILTLYERDKAESVSYVGDARLSAFPMGETRLLPYALDEKITVEREIGTTYRLARGSIAKGVLKYVQLSRQTTTYKVKGPAREGQLLIVTQPRAYDGNLVKPDSKGVELSEGNYRIPLPLPGGDQTQTFDVVQEQPQQMQFRLIDAVIASQLTAFTQAQDFDAKTREAIGKVMQLQQAVVEAEQRLRQADAARKEIVDEQSRLRENLGKVPANSDLQRRYLATLDKQETDIEAIAKRKADSQTAVDTARDALRTYIAQLG
jgi:hypothetical protein